MDGAFLERIRGERTIIQRGLQMVHGILTPILVTLLLAACGGSGESPSGPDQSVEGPYLGETPPGTTPRQFASQILTQQFHSSPVFSPSGDEMYWSGMDGGGLQFMRLENGEWSAPQVAPFNLLNSGEPVFGPAGDTLYFLSAQSYQGSQGSSDENVWRVTRTAGGWSDPTPLGSPVNDHPMHWGVSLAANRNLYLGHTEGSGEIFFSEFQDGIYQEAVSVGEAINTEDMETTPCIAPDESYLVFSRVVQNGRGPINLYVSFRGQDGSWNEAVPLTGVNTDGREISPRLSPDGEYLFFLRTVNGELMPFWVQSTVITALRPL
jgi:hypothetical protein